MISFIRSSRIALAIALLLSIAPKARADVNPADVVKAVLCGGTAALATYCVFFKNPDKPANKVDTTVDKVLDAAYIKPYVQAVHRPVYKAAQHVVNNWFTYATLTAAFLAGVKYGAPTLSAHTVVTTAENAAKNWNPLSAAAEVAAKTVKK